jgi:predicted nucleic acid-binding protein
MYLLDTNVISELRKGGTSRMDPNVRDWAKSVSTSTLYLSAISILELEIGILLLERRDRSQGAVLRAWMEGHVLTTFEGRILAVDTSVARRCATFHVPSPRSVHGMSVVTRNVSDFKPTGVAFVNPWNS